MRISGLGACSSVILAPEQIYQYALDAGFPEDVATTMTAVALRESSGCPTAYNGGSPPGAEDSYGLWQINVKGNPGIVSALGLSNKTDLFDPATNAAAAVYLWGGKPENLNTAWYLNRPGYQEGYLKYMPTAQQAASNVLGSVEGAPASLTPEGPGGVDKTAMVGVALAGLLGVFLLAPRNG